MDDFYRENRHGSSEFASGDQMSDAGLYKAEGFYLGRNEEGVDCYSQQASAVLLCAGARGFKGSNIIPSLLKGFRAHGDIRDPHIVSLDLKNQNGPVTELQPDTRIITLSPRKPRHRMNPTSYLHINSPTLGPHMKLFVENWVVAMGGKSDPYFEQRARLITEPCALSYVEQYGALDLPGFANVMNLLVTDTEQWKAFEYWMEQSQFAAARAMSEYLATIRTSNTPNGDGFGGARGVIENSFACMSDGQLRDMVSEPFDFDPAEMTVPNGPRFQINIAESMEFVPTAAPVIRAIFTSIMLHKRRVLGSCKQVWLLDEIGNIGRWPLATELATFGPGFGLRPIYVVQSTTQLNNLNENAGKIIPNSCGTHIYRAVRDIDEAKRVSQMIGDMTLEVEDAALNERALLAQQQALDAMLFEGADPFNTGRDMALHDAR